MQIRTLLAIVATGIVAVQAVAVPADPTYEVVAKDVDHCVPHEKLDESDWEDIKENEEEYASDGEFDRRSHLGKRYEKKGKVAQDGGKFICKWQYASTSGWCDDQCTCDEQSASLVKVGDDCSYKTGTAACEC
ncbi:hypothetical protein F5X99DRAFT_382407 [Biscogniauxia marginata]|nr:hypothetical protein F5X99DRAFT_382407 [Biscogniauxia marginata]